MTPLNFGMPLAWQSLSTFIGLILSLFILSFILRESILVRLAQYLLIGVTLAYVAVLVLYNILWLRLLQPVTEVWHAGAFLPAYLWRYGTPLLFSVIMALTGLLWMGSSERPEGGWRAWLRLLAMVPAGLLAGVGLGVGIAGAIQGTLLPQFWRAAALGWSPSGESGWLVGILTLVITIGVLLYLQTGIQSRSTAQFAGLLAIGGWVGQRALWLAAGFIFARLFASRLTLLIARLDLLLTDLGNGALWQWLQSIGGAG